MMNFSIWMKWGLLAIFLGGLSLLPAQAALNLKPVAVNNETPADITSTVMGGTSDLIDAYFKVPAMPANPTTTTGRLRIAKDKPTYDGSPSTYSGWISGGTAIYFVRDAAAETLSLDDSTVTLRIWSGSPNTPGGYYSLAQGFGNSETGGSDTSFSAVTNYQAASPYQPEIYQFTESKTTDINNTISGSLTIYSRQPAPTAGYREINGYNWKIGLSNDVNAATTIALGNNTIGGNTIYISGTSLGASLAIDLSKSTIASGTQLWFFAEHRNWFTIGNNFSVGKMYAISGVGGGGGVVSKTYNITPVINTFSIPVDCNKSVTYQVGAAPVNTLAAGMTVRDLLTAVGNVSVFGWYDSVAKKQDGFTMVNSSALDSSMLVPGMTTYADATALLNSNLRQDFPYQISLVGSAAPVSIMITGTR